MLVLGYLLTNKSLNKSLYPREPLSPTLKVPFLPISLCQSQMILEKL
jgi:hypothetical protein